MKFRTRAVHAGREPDPTTGAVTQPIVLSTTFEREKGDGEPRRFSYGRQSNPNRAALEIALAELDGGADAACFSSGSAAATAVFQSLASGDHVVLPSDRYHGTLGVVRDVLARWGLTHSIVDVTDESALAAAINERTRIVWLETPSNPRLVISDIARIAVLAHERRALCVVDNTFATACLQRPLEHGADLVMYSTTKYMSGHSDVLGGAIVTRASDESWDRIREIQHLGGAVPSPFECWLTLRSLATLPLRMRAHSDGALAVAQYLASHPSIESVYYPGLASDPGHEVARRQMTMFSGMLSFRHAGGEAAAIAAVDRVRVFRRATSLGGVESLIEHRASSEGPSTLTPRDLVRLSVGIEHPDDLIADLEQALAAAA